MIWGCRFILPFMLACVASNQLHTASAIENNPAKEIIDQGVFIKSSTPGLPTSDDIEIKRPKRGLFDQLKSEAKNGNWKGIIVIENYISQNYSEKGASSLTTSPPSGNIEELTESRFVSMRSMITGLGEMVQSNKDSINELRKNTEVQEAFAKEQWQLFNASMTEMREKIEAQSKYHKTPKQNLLSYLHRVSNSKETISGVETGNVHTHNNEGVRTIEKIAGVTPGITNAQMPWLNSNETAWTSFVDDVISTWNNHQLVRIYWFEGNPLLNLENFTAASHADDTEKRWDDLITDGSEINKVWKEELAKIAPYLNKLQSAGVVPILDILPDINILHGSTWGGHPGVNGSAKLYQITHDYLTKEQNLTSLIWAWCIHAKDMTHFEEFWPGKDYVEVASVVMARKEELSMTEYERLVNLVGDIPVSIEEFTVPSLELLTTQPRWTWFTARDLYLENTEYNNASDIKATLSSPSVINQGNIDFFNDHH